KTPQNVPLTKMAEPKKSLAAETLRKMNEPFDFPLAAVMSFKDALKIMEDRGCPPITIHMQAFKDEAPEIPDLYEAQIKLPPVKGLTRGKVLRMMLNQVSDLANYLVHPGYLEITTNSAMLPNHQFVSHASFIQRPLEEALNELSELSGI